MTTLQSGEDALLRRVRAFDWARLKWCFAATCILRKNSKPACVL